MTSTSKYKGPGFWGHSLTSGLRGPNKGIRSDVYLLKMMDVLVRQESRVKRKTVILRLIVSLVKRQINRDRVWSGTRSTLVSGVDRKTIT